MKKLFLTLMAVMLAAAMVAGCFPQGGEQPNETNGYETNGEEVNGNGQLAEQETIEELYSPLVTMFWEYSQAESRELGEQIMQEFKNDIGTFLGAMVEAERRGIHPEQTLILVGHTVAMAMRHTPELYAEYTAVLEEAENMNLGADEARMLGFINANIEHWYNH